MFDLLRLGLLVCLLVVDVGMRLILYSGCVDDALVIGWCFGAVFGGFCLLCCRFVADCCCDFELLGMVGLVVFCCVVCLFIWFGRLTFGLWALLGVRFCLFSVVVGFGCLWMVG